MINFELAKKAFKEYLQNYNLKDGKIDLKIRHTFHVVNASEYIAKELALNNEDIELAKMIALLHDIGRFEQLRIYNSFLDYKTIDHANLGNEILFKDNLIRNFLEDTQYDEIVSKAILNHNKFSIEYNLSPEELLHAKIIRDADKLDIFRVRIEDSIENVIDNCSKEILENSTISENIFNDFFNNKLILSTDRKTPMDFWVSGIAYIFDFNFSCSLKFVKNMDYINKMVDKFDYKNAETKERMEIIRNHAIEFIEKSLL